LRYAGKTDLSDTTRLELRRDQALFDGRFRLADVTGWIDSDSTSPLPPMDGRFQASRVEIAGARLEGVEATLDDETLPDTIGTTMP